MTSHVDLAEFVSAYVVEAEEQLSIASARLLAIEASERAGQAHPRAVRELFRALHTIKGLSAMVGIEPVVAIAHRVEAALRVADRSSGKLAPGAVDTLLGAIRAIEQRVRALSDGAAVAPAQASLLAQLDALEVGEPGMPPPVAGKLKLDASLAEKLAPFEKELLQEAPRTGKRARRMAFVPSPARASQGMTINAVRDRVGAIGEIVKVLPVSLPPSDSAPGGLAFVLLVITDATNEALAAACGIEPSGVEPLFEEEDHGPAATATEADLAIVADDPLDTDSLGEEMGQRWNVLRVDVARVDDAMERLASLIVTRSRLATAITALAAAGADTREIRQVAADNTRQLRDLRSAILQVRMIPVKEILDRVPLIVRSLKRASGKQVRLVIDAGTAELDKAVAERIFPAIVHLVRNAVDHAIEPPEERRRAGKPEEGLVRISCSTRSNTRLELTVEDDGRGIDGAAVARRAGRELPDTDAALLYILCQPGFSTRDQVTMTSGRGMGMDIVKRVVMGELGGEILLRTEIGAGTSFTLRVPLTIAIIDAFLLECASHRYVAPVSIVEEIIEIEPDHVMMVPSASDHGDQLGIVERRGEAVPLLDLSALLNLPRAGERPRKALVVRQGGQPIAFVLDRVLGQQEAVVRPLVDPLVRVPGISGATDLGDGRPTLVLDLVALGASIRGRRRPRIGPSPAPLLLAGGPRGGLPS